MFTSCHMCALLCGHECAGPMCCSQVYMFTCCQNTLWDMLTKCLSSRPPSSFLFFLFWTVCVVHTQKEEELFMLSGTLMIVGVPVVTIMHSSWVQWPPLPPYRPHSYKLDQHRSPIVSETPYAPLICGAIPHTHASADTCLPAHTHSSRMLDLCVCDGQIMAQCMQGLHEARYSRTLPGWSRSCRLPRTRFRIRAWHRANGRGVTAVLRLSHGCLDTQCVGPLGQFKSSCMILFTVLECQACHDWSFCQFLGWLCDVMFCSIFSVAVFYF